KVWDVRTGRCESTLKGHGEAILSVAFSPDGKQVASASKDSTVKLWDVATGQCVRSYATGRVAHNLSFFAPTGTQLRTDVGTFSPETSSPALLSPSRNLHAFGFSADNAWITGNSKQLVWLPPEYRPVRSAVMGSGIAIACSSGRVLILRFS
ncbi:WD40-repeat-containing domain protein, partial [Dactylonectria macrodidyma]